MIKIGNIKDLYKSFHEESKKAGDSSPMALNPMTLPRLKYVVLSVGCGKYHKDSNKIEYVQGELNKIAGQKSVRTKAKKSISNFAVREGMDVGLRVTLRGNNMFDFLTRLIMIGMPRMQDFNGLNERSFDPHYNYNFGIQRQDIFPESNGQQLFGMNICMGLFAKNKKDAISLLRGIGMPFISIRSTTGGSNPTGAESSSTIGGSDAEKL